MTGSVTEERAVVLTLARYRLLGFEAAAKQLASPARLGLASRPLLKLAPLVSGHLIFCPNFTRPLSLQK
jgi:hypothetical protein